MKSSFLTVLTLFTLSSAAFGEFIYTNSLPANDQGTSLSFDDNSVVAAGNGIAFIGTSRLLTNANFQIYNQNLTDTLSAVTLSLYNVSGNTLGSLIGDYTLAPDTFLASQVATLIFSLPNVLVPDDIVWTLAFSNSSGLGLNYFDPPDRGTSNGAWWNTGSGLARVDFPDANENYHAEFLAADETPEPSTWLLVAGGLTLVGWQRRSLRRG